jgi:hypothetical protein
MVTSNGVGKKAEGESIDQTRRETLKISKKKKKNAKRSS